MICVDVCVLLRKPRRASGTKRVRFVLTVRAELKESLRPKSETSTPIMCGSVLLEHADTRAARVGAFLYWSSDGVMVTRAHTYTCARCVCACGFCEGVEGAAYVCAIAVGLICMLSMAACMSGVLLSDYGNIYLNNCKQYNYKFSSQSACMYMIY